MTNEQRDMLIEMHNATMNAMIWFSRKEPQCTTHEEAIHLGVTTISAALIAILQYNLFMLGDQERKTPEPSAN